MPVSGATDPAADPDRRPIRLALPKGRIQKGVLALLADARIRVREGERGYRPRISLRGYETKLLKPQNIVEMLHVGSRDLGFAGADWVRELGAEVVELLDTGLDPVRLVAAAPAALAKEDWRKRKLVVASEYERVSADWIAEQKLDAVAVRTFGATEVFPPEDADVIIDNVATGSTLRANGLVVIDEVMRSSTRLFASPRALEEPAVRRATDELVMCLRSVLDARKRVMLEVNVPADALEAICEALPCMREPTVATLHAGEGFAVKAAVPSEDLPSLVPRLKALGGSDIVVTALSQIVL